MRRPPWLLLALLLATTTCRSGVDAGMAPGPDPGVLALDLLAPATAPVPATSGVARITGNGVDLSRTLAPGQSAAVEVPPGTYTLVLAGLADGAVVSLGQRADVAVRAGVETRATVQLQPFVPDPPEAPASAPAGEAVTVQWDPVPGASLGYEVEWSPSAGFGSGVERETTTGSSLDVNLPSQGVYFFRVRALTSAVAPAGYWSDPSAGTGAVVVEPPAIVLSQDSVGFTGQAGGADPVARTVAVSNGGGGSLEALTAVVAGYGEGEPGGWLSAVLDDVVAPAGLLLTPDLEGLEAGLHTATVEVRSGDPEVDPVPVRVTLELTSATAPPSIQLNVTRRAFAAQAGGLPPPAQFVEVTNGGGGALDGLALTVLGSGAPPDGWLTVDLDTTAAPATITVQPDIRGLAVGSYTSTLRVSAEGAANSPQSVIVTLSVRQAPVPPSIALGRDSVGFEAMEGEEPADQTVTVANGGAGTLARLSTAVASYGGGAEGWLSAALSDTIAPATLTLAASTDGLDPGSYAAVVDVRSPQADNNPQTVAVTLVVAAAPPDTFNVALSASPTAGGTVSGGGDFEEGRPVTVVATANSGYGFTRWTEGGTGVSTSADYTFTVTGDRTLVAVFTPDPVPAIGLSADSVAFTTAEGGEPGAQTVSITNTGGGTLGGLRVSVEGYTGGSGGWLEASLGSGAAPSTLTLETDDADELDPGVYTARVEIASPQATNSPRVLTVTLTVTAEASGVGAADPETARHAPSPLRVVPTPPDAHIHP